jgi:UDP-N-acetylmuramoyl-L-alanyl-D-glutamate--2,6-diaminopimelate ligase
MKLKTKLASLPGYNTIVLPYHYVQTAHAASKHNYPAANMTVIGVTGTNGKTTTCNMIFHMLKEAGLKAGLMTTVAWGTWRKTEAETMHYTTPSPNLLNQRLSQLRDDGVEFLVLEVSSHALAQGRIFGVPIDMAVMTNVTHEHLDYHGTLANYRQAKVKLFKKAKFGVINADDPSAKWFKKASRDLLTYGIKKGDFQATDIKLAADGVTYNVPSQRLQISTQIPGEFNVYNSLAAAVVGQHYGLTRRQIEHGIASLTGVDGRMNRVDEGQNFEVIVDFGHTPDAFEKVFSSMKPPKGKGRLIILFGSPGRRDSSTYEPKGEIAGRYGDLVILTEDDARDIPVREISEMHARGAKKACKMLNKDLFIIDNREEAIEFAFKKARKGDVVLLMTKGHERTIIRADGEHPWSDVEVSRRILRRLGREH